MRNGPSTRHFAPSGWRLDGDSAGLPATDVCVHDPWLRIVPQDPAELVVVSESRGSAAERHLLERAHRGSRSAVGALFERYGAWLRRWARRRLPPRVRGAIDTSDIVQDALHHTFARFTSFRSRQAGVLRMYLRRAVQNRIRDELRRVARRRDAIMPDHPVLRSDNGAPQLRELIDEETGRRYLEALRRLPARDRRLIVGRAELAYTSEQLAFMERLPSPAAARGALRRALVRLSDLMSDG